MYYRKIFTNKNNTSYIEYLVVTYFVQNTYNNFKILKESVYLITHSEFTVYNANYPEIMLAQKCRLI